MVALAADAVAGMRAAKVVRAETAGIKTAFPNARDGLATPAEGLFDAEADATTALAQRQALIGVDGRRRFAVTAEEMIWIDPEAGVPAFTLIDSQQSANGAFLAARVEIDLNTETTTLELFG